MATTNPEIVQVLSPSIRAKLDALRSRIRAYIWVQGVALAIAALGAAFWLSLTIDWLFEPPIWFRGLILAASLGLALWVVYRMVISRLAVPLANTSMATVLERKFKTLDDSLLTTVFLAERHIDPEEVNPEMLARTQREADERIADVRVEQVFNVQPLRRSALGAVLLAVSVLAFGVLIPSAFGLWARRNILLADELWPRQSRFIQIVGLRDGEEVPFTDGVLKVARGGELTVIARADTHADRIPSAVEIRYRAEGGPRQRKFMAREGEATEADKWQEYSYRFEGVLAPIHFDVYDTGTSGDRVYDLKIDAVESPTAELVLEPEFPAYTQRTSRPLAVTGVMAIPLGSKVTVRGKPNKPLVRVEIGSSRAKKSEPVTVIEKDGLGPDGRSFAYTIEKLTGDTALTFTLHDADGIRGREPVQLVLTAQLDEPPQLRVRMDGIGTAITPEARIPFIGEIVDDYGVDKVFAEVLVDQTESNRELLIALDKFPTQYNVKNRSNPEKDLAYEVGGLKLKPDQKIQLNLRASDRFSFEGIGPNEGQSERWLLDVVTGEQLLNMLTIRELLLGQRFDQMITETSETCEQLRRITFKLEDEAPPEDKTAKEPEDTAGREPGDKPVAKKTEGAEPGDAARAPKPMTADEHRELQRNRAERALQNARKNGQEVNGVAESFDDIGKQLVNNRLNKPGLRERLDEDIAKPLHVLADDKFPQLERSVDRLLENIGNAETGPDYRKRAYQQADAILRAMKEVRAKMTELESYEEAIHLLETIIEFEKDVTGATKERHKASIKDSLNDLKEDK